MLPDSIAEAIQYADGNGIEIPADIRARARRVGALKAGKTLPEISAQYTNAIIEAIVTYFEGGSVTSPRNLFRRAMVVAFGAAFDLGWLDGGGEMPPDETALEWFNPRVNQEFGYIDGLFANIKQLKKEDGFDYYAWATQRAAGYARSLGGVYNAGKMFAQGSKMLTWHLGETEVHCDTCAKLDGQRHRASWYIARNYIPRQSGASMDCGGYNCDCSLKDDKGNSVTI